MQVLDARHCELYLEESFRDGTWEYEDLGEHFIDEEVAAAACAIFNGRNLASHSTDRSFPNHLAIPVLCSLVHACLIYV